MAEFLPYNGIAGCVGVPGGPHRLIRKLPGVYSYARGARVSRVLGLCALLGNIFFCFFCFSFPPLWRFCYFRVHGPQVIVLRDKVRTPQIFRSRDLDRILISKNWSLDCRIGCLRVDWMHVPPGLTSILHSCIGNDLGLVRPFARTCHRH